MESVESIFNEPMAVETKSILSNFVSIKYILGRKNILGQTP